MRLLALLFLLASAPAPASAQSLDAASTICGNHSHLTGTGPIATRTKTYDTGFEGCTTIDSAVAAQRSSAAEQSVLQGALDGLKATK